MRMDGAPQGIPQFFFVCEEPGLDSDEQPGHSAGQMPPLPFTPSVLEIPVS